jgi:hypothetical protein
MRSVLWHVLKIVIFFIVFFFFVALTEAAVITVNTHNYYGCDYIDCLPPFVRTGLKALLSGN